MNSSTASSPGAPRADGGGPPLVLLAAGLGSRFGGVKPLAPVGPEREPLLGLALDQAATAGFTDVVVVVGGRTREPITDALAAWPAHLDVHVAEQDGVGPPRLKPWGTVAALLAASRARPSMLGHVLANGDDLYGAMALGEARRWILGDAPADGAIVGYEVERTLSSMGGVSRAVPVVEARGRVVSLAEQRDVQHRDGAIRAASGAVLAPQTPVSMNLFALRASITVALGALFERFLAERGDDAYAELGLPDAIGRLLAEQRASIDLIVTRSRWHGVTWPDDVERVRDELRAEMRHG